VPNYNEMHWSALKKLMEEQGQKFESKAQAIAFLSGPEDTGIPFADVQEDTGIPFVDVQEENENLHEVLDKSKSFGEIFGIMAECESARYIQNGKFYTSEGILING